MSIIALGDKMHKKKASIVIGLGFGDEGKGLTTHFLSLQSPNSLVIRFNGGQQAGHTVRTKQGKNHIFSNFGAGTFSQIPTYWSQFCTFSPSSLLKEYEMLQQQIQHLPILWVDKLCPVTTHYDILFNRLSEQYRGLQKHGS
ncbi:MAG: adenylosuccinate synthetase, partial [Thermonemataceae bacterium]|nr:adenylosuccinate synthetase [Thermonemataceae bacterium]